MGPASRLGLLSWARSDCHGCQHFPQFLQAIVDVFLLVTIPLTGHHQVALLRNATPKMGQEPFPHGFRKTGAGRDVPTHRGLGIDLVDILTTWSAAPIEAKPELIQGNAYARIHDQHDGGTLLAEGNGLWTYG